MNRWEFPLNTVNHGSEFKPASASILRVPRCRALGICLLLAVGCGSPADNPAPPPSPPTAAAAETTNPKESPRVVADSPATEPAPARQETISVPIPRPEKPAKPAHPAPTAEQIAAWTPAPFEPLQLLASREWTNTSFTSCIAPTPDGKRFIAAGSRVLLWSLAGEEPEHVFLELTEVDKDRDIRALAVAPDGKWFAVGDSTGTLRIWGLEDCQEITAKQLYSTGIQHFAISPDAQEIASITYDNEVTTWSAADLKQKKNFKIDTNGLVRIQYIAPGLLAAAGETTSMWDTTTGAMKQQLSPGRYSSALARSPDGSRFIFGSTDSLQLWNAAESKPESAITNLVTGDELLEFSPDGKFLATTNGRTLQLWNLAERRVVQVIDSFGYPIVGLAWLPQTNLLAVASDIGCTRIWGTPGQGAPLGLKPLHAPVAMPDAASKEPATHAQLEQVIDLRTFPTLPGSESSVLAQESVSFVAPTTQEVARTFYRYFLEKAGWTEEEPGPNDAAMTFRKNGFALTASFYDAGEGKTNVMLHHAGNYDLRGTPKFDAAPIEIAHEYESTVSYRTKADLIKIETTLLRKLHEAGWTAYARLKSSHSEEPDNRDMTFLKNGTTLRVSIGKFPVDPSSYTIQYSLFPDNSSVPVPPDSGFVEFDGSTEPCLAATTAMTLDEARQFYDKELAAEGWLVRSIGRTLKDDHCWLPYFRGQRDVTVGLTKLPNGRTMVQVGDAANSSWQLAKPEEKSPEADAVGLEAADFPILNASKTAKFDAIDKNIELQIDASTLANVAEQYTKSLKPLGWKLQDGGIRAEDYTFLTFKKDDKEIALRARPKDGNALVSFRGDGLLWNQELPGGKQIVSYETWLRQNKLPAGLEWLDQYEAEMRAIQAP